jgi:acetolactate synthase-1/2/3 large subunit
MDGASTTVSTAEGLLRVLKARGIDYVLANAGTDFAPVIEGLVRLAGRKESIPRFITVPHENLAMAMAHGYYQVAGKPAGVMVHVTVGTGNTICALMNAARDNVPLLLMAGRTPLTQDGHIASRSAPIHWGQENFDQAGVVREYTKWDFELRAGQPVEELVGRALDIALAEPRGPVYLTLPREVLASPHKDSITPLPPTELSTPQPSARHVEQLAEWIAAAEFPLILTSNLGRDTAAVGVLAALAERHAIPVAQPHASCVNLPASHPFNLGHAGTELLGKADLLLVVDCEVPWYPRYATPRADAKVVHLGVDPLFERYPHRAFTAQLAITGSSTKLCRLAPRRAAQRIAAARSSPTSKPRRPPRSPPRTTGLATRSRSGTRTSASACTTRCRRTASSSPSSAWAPITSPSRERASCSASASAGA